MTKDELLQKINASRQALLATLEKVPPERRAEPFSEGGWSVKDILVHLNYWEGQLVTMLFQLRSGATPTTLHFSGKNVDEINAAWFLQGKTRSWEMAWSDFNGILNQLLRRVGEFSDIELNRPSFHPRLKDRPLWEWIVGDSFEHEDEHRAAIQEWLARKM
jgi:hypothetical protein